MITGSEAFEEQNRAVGHHNRKRPVTVEGDDHWHIPPCSHTTFNQGRTSRTSWKRVIQSDHLKPCPDCVPMERLVELQREYGDLKHLD